ncbi:MAG: hypothetical protein CME32_21330, partial [Gimesia sp.]|nr:hypothetical protein [Gimesia sp.]
VTQYRQNLPASQAAKAELERLEKLVAQLKADVESSKADAAKTKAASDKLARAEKLVEQAARTAKSAEAKSAPANTKFAAWSKLITVNVVEPAKKK